MAGALAAGCRWLPIRCPFHRVACAHGGGRARHRWLFGAVDCRVLRDRRRQRPRCVGIALHGSPRAGDDAAPPHEQHRRGRARLTLRRPSWTPRTSPLVLLEGRLARVRGRRCSTVFGGVPPIAASVSRYGRKRACRVVARTDAPADGCSARRRASRILVATTRTSLQAGASRPPLRRDRRLPPYRSLI